MDEQVPVRTILQTISNLGSASLESLMRELESQAAANKVARALQSARERGLIETASTDRRTGDPPYRLTATGLAALTHQQLRNGRGARPSARRDARVTAAVSLQSVLDVLADFDQFGGGSLGLVAWELDVQERAIAAVWSLAVDDRVLEQSDANDALGETMWTLTERGQRAREEFEHLSG